MNNYTDNKATLKWNLEVHSEIGQTFKTELSLGSSQRLKSVNHFRKKLPPLTGLWGLTGL